jgi:NAD(P)-dependent dehydrogenase (short-subunit alcohol dehydrogenase family)
MPGELNGKVIVLTGGADGIGRECATAYAREGAVVAVLDMIMSATLSGVFTGEGRFAPRLDRALMGLSITCLPAQRLFWHWRIAEYGTGEWQ